MSSSQSTPLTPVTASARPFGGGDNTTAAMACAPLLPVASDAALSVSDPAERYVLDFELARGGMGRVFAGRDLRFGREVAIKVLQSAKPEGRARFEREALLAARLQHPGIVPVYDVGCWASGEPFLVMRLVKGRSLLKAMEDTESVSDRLALLPTLIAVADAMAYAHDRGVVHRDLKPSNVLVGAFGDVAIVDWGLAKTLNRDDAAASVDGTDSTASAVPRAAASRSLQAELTAQGAVMGTPAYMAPEQAAGQDVDARADVYALGAVLYQTLSGALPRPRTTSEAPVKLKLGPTPLRELEPRLPRDLLAVVEKAMAAAPDSRYPSAFEFAEDLRRFQSGVPVQALTHGRARLLARWFRQHPSLPLWLAVSGLLFWRACR